WPGGRRGLPGRRSGRPGAGCARQPGACAHRGRRRSGQRCRRGHRGWTGRMILGRVVGYVWASRKDPRLGQGKLLIVERSAWYAPPGELGHLVAVDTLDAGVGDDVVVCLGAPARWHMGSVNLPIEAAVMAVVDRCEIAEAELTHKRPFRWITATPPQM